MGKQQKKEASLVKARTRLMSARWGQNRALRRHRRGAPPPDKVENLETLAIAVKALRTIANSSRQAPGALFQGIAKGALKRMGVELKG